MVLLAGKKSLKIDIFFGFAIKNKRRFDVSKVMTHPVLRLICVSLIEKVQKLRVISTVATDTAASTVSGENK
jgi:hypothetical protein